MDHISVRVTSFFAKSVIFLFRGASSTSGLRHSNVPSNLWWSIGNPTPSRSCSLFGSQVASDQDRATYSDSLLRNWYLWMRYTDQVLPPQPGCLNRFCPQWSFRDHNSFDGVHHCVGLTDRSSLACCVGEVSSSSSRNGEVESLGRDINILDCIEDSHVATRTTYPHTSAISCGIFRIDSFRTQLTTRFSIRWWASLLCCYGSEAGCRNFSLCASVPALTGTVRRFGSRFQLGDDHCSLSATTGNSTQRRRHGSGQCTTRNLDLFLPTCYWNPDSVPGSSESPLIFRNSTLEFPFTAFHHTLDNFHPKEACRIRRERSKQGG